MGLRDWVSEKGAAERATEPDGAPAFNGAPRLGLGEGRRGRAAARRGAASFNGAPRLGLGEGLFALSSRCKCSCLQWGSETGSRRRRRRAAVAVGPRCPSMGLRDWVSEKATPPAARVPFRAVTFNGAPRLGLGEGMTVGGLALSRQDPSMGLRDWVSEKGSSAPCGTPRRPCLQWGSETGSRRRTDGACAIHAPAIPSMGLRDWVSEKACCLTAFRPRGAPSMGLRDWVSEKERKRRIASTKRRPSMGLRDWVSEKDPIDRSGARCQPRLQWGSETGSRRRALGHRLSDLGPLLLQWGSETGSRRRFGASPTAPCSAASLQWGSETGSRRRVPPGWRAEIIASPSLQWGSETGSRRRTRPGLSTPSLPPTFNGAPRLGLGEGSRRGG